MRDAYGQELRPANVPSSAASAHAKNVQVIVTGAGPKSAGAPSWARRGALPLPFDDELDEPERLIELSGSREFARTVWP
jgi:hypothetical protein